MKLPIFEFMRRFLQHILPRGFHKVRYYGLLSPANKLLRQRIQLLLHKPVTDEALQRVQAEPESAPAPIAARALCIEVRISRAPLHSFFNVVHR